MKKWGKIQASTYPMHKTRTIHKQFQVKHIVKNKFNESLNCCPYAISKENHVY